MYPFYLLDLPENTTDEEVEARYRELLRKFPPDAEPERCAAVRRAYEAVRDRRGRVATRLFHFDREGRALSHELPDWVRTRRRTRRSPEELAAILRDSV